MKTITQLLFDAYKKDIENRLWQQWLVQFANMDKETFISFDNYKKELMKPPLAKVDIEQVLEDAEEIKNADQKNTL